MISPSPEPDESEATFQIILCDYCDSEFYSDEAFEVSNLKFKSKRILYQIPMLNIATFDRFMK